MVTTLKPADLTTPAAAYRRTNYHRAAPNVYPAPVPVRFLRSMRSRHGLPRTLMPSIDSVVHTFREADAQAHRPDL